MGMSMHLIGVTTDESPEYQKHAKVLQACYDAGIELLPKETAEFFNCTYPELYLLEEVLEVKVPKVEWTDESSRWGYEVYIKDIPAHVEKIRFYNAY
jgi:hypothetical protein